MHFGLYVPLFGDYADARILASLARDAETAGWEGFFLWDHVFTDWPDRLVDPWVALTAIALNTEHIRLGTLVTPSLGVALGNWQVKRFPLITCQMVALHWESDWG